MMDEIRNLLLFACEDLEAVQQMMRVVEDHPEHTAERDTLRVAIRALGPIIDDIREAISGISMELEKEHVQQD